MLEFFGFFVIGSTIWTVIDAVRLQRYKYKGYGGAFVVFIGLALFWIVCFPYYLITRADIVNGTAEVRPEYENDPPPQMNKQAAIPMQPNKLLLQ